MKSRMVKISSSERTSNGLRFSVDFCFFITVREGKKKISVNAFSSESPRSVRAETKTEDLGRWEKMALVEL